MIVMTQKEKRRSYKRIAESRLGETRCNSLNNTMTIVEYISSNDITVQFADGYIAKNVTYWNFKIGKVKSLYDRSVFGIGYLGEGEYTTKDTDGNTIQEYRTWSHMLERCYSKKYQQRKPTYKGCTVCDEWLNFQNFAEWYNKNYYEINGETICLDKDILVIGNKLYSPNTCIFVPNSINVLFATRKKYKEKFIIQMAEEYKDKIPDRLYNAMMNWV